MQDVDVYGSVLGHHNHQDAGTRPSENPNVPWFSANAFTSSAHRRPFIDLSRCCSDCRRIIHSTKTGGGGGGGGGHTEISLFAYKNRRKKMLLNVSTVVMMVIYRLPTAVVENSFECARLAIGGGEGAQWRSHGKAKGIIAPFPTTNEPCFFFCFSKRIFIFII